MDFAFVVALIEGVVSHAIYSLIEARFQDDKNRKTVQQLKDVVAGNQRVSQIVQKTLASVARTQNVIEGDDLDRLRFYLVSPEVEAIVMQVIGYKKSKSKTDSRAAAKQQFGIGLNVALRKPTTTTDELASGLFEAVASACDEGLTAAVEKGVLSAHEVKSIQRHRIVLDEIAAIGKKLDFLLQISTPQVQEFTSFESKYRIQVSGRHQHIIPPNFDAVKRVPIDDLYVSPTVEPIGTPRQREQEYASLEYSGFVSQIRRTVLLGNPGGGKSTMSLKICHDLATQGMIGDNNTWVRTPVLVVLRDYGAEKKEKGCSILQFIESRSNSTYQQKPPNSAFEYLLLTGRLLVIFDGLDELLETHYRQEISADVESFSVAYPSVPILVTSRFVGYQEAPLDSKAFTCFLLQDFREKQIKEYAEKWFALDYDLTEEERRRKVSDFLSESRIVPDLRANPLMLALICNIYRGAGYIPRNRPDVYEKCAIMLFERWDSGRGIKVELPFEAHVIPTMTFLANWIYQDATLQSGVAERGLITKAQEYLERWLYEDHVEALHAAEQFIAFCRGRAWVFTDVGTTRDGERLYQFAHRTFLEYFAALYLVRQNASPARLLELLLPRIAKREWDVVSQLAFQLLHRNVEGAGDELIENLVKGALSRKGKTSLNLFEFGARCLQFIVPKPKVTRSLAEGCFSFALSRVKMTSDRATLRTTSRSSLQEDLLVMIGVLLSCNAENRGTVRQTIDAFFTEKIKADGSVESALAILFAAHFVVGIHLVSTGGIAKEVMSYWEELSNKIIETHVEAVNLAARRYINVARTALYATTYFDVEQFVEAHGLNGIFSDEGRESFLGYSSGVGFALLHQLSRLPFDKLGDKAQLTRATFLGQLYLTAAPPWAAPQRQSHDHWQWQMLTGYGRQPEATGPMHRFEELDANVKFCFLILAATHFERSSNQKGGLDELAKSSHPYWKAIAPVILGRFNKQHTSATNAELAALGLDQKQSEKVIRWIKGEIDFVVTGSGIPSVVES